MVSSCALLSVFLLATASVQPAQVPATGKQVATVRVEQAGMVHISARSPHGTACTLVDHQRGPFASSGRVGQDNCELDLLLDAGVYRLRLTSPDKGRGQVSLSAKPFADRFEEPLLLPTGREDHNRLPEGQQASWWVRIGQRRHVELTVIGRTAGMVRLWRDGRWVEDIAQEHNLLTPKPGQPLHHWKLAGMLEAGDYLLVAYGADAKAWAAGKGDDVLFVANGYPQAPADRVATFQLPAWGRVALQVPASRLAAFLALDEAPEADVRLELLAMPDKTGDRTERRSGSCRVAPKALVPSCSTFGSRDSRHVLVVTGAPGATGRVRWAGYLSSSTLADGLYTGATASIEFDAPGSGRFLVATDDVPVDPDAAPLSCQLDPVRRVRWKKTHHDYLKIDDERMFERRFNYEGRDEDIWFEIGKSGLYTIATSGEREVSCELFSQGAKLTRVESGCVIERPLGEGLYRLKLYRGKPGIEKLTIRFAEGNSRLPLGLGSKTGDPTPVAKNSCRFAGVDLVKKGRYRLRLNRRGRVTARGLIVRELPLKLTEPLPLVVDPGEAVSLPLAPGGAIEIRSAGAADFRCALAGSAESVARDGVCRLAATGKRGQLKISNPTAESLVVTALRPRPPEAKPSLAVHSPKRRKLPSLKPGATRHFDFDRGQAHSLTFDVTEAGLYHLTTTGLLSTECRVRTPIFPRLASNSGGGRGRNCLVAGYLRPGRYLLTAAATGRARGRAGVTVVRRPVKAKPSIAGKGEVFFRVEADALVKQKLTIKTAGRYGLRTTGQGVALQCRLEDADGWPLVRVPTRCGQELELDAGTYGWGQMPLTVESMRKTELFPVLPPEVLKGDKAHRVKLNQTYTAELGPDGKDDFRFDLRAELPVHVGLTDRMQGRLYRLVEGAKPALVEAIPPAGKQLDLTPGRYRLTTEHSRADIGIRYRLTLSTGLLAPGVAMDNVPVPGELKVRMPESGVLRIGSKGEVDVRCRLLDAGGRLVAEGDDVGADWNCLAAVPVAAGDYRLVLEAENAIGGRTRIAVNAPKVKQVGGLTDGQLLETGNRVLLAELPKAKPGVVQEVGFKSKLRFSCQLEDAGGQALAQQIDVLRCGFLVNPGAVTYKVRLWTRRWSGKLKTKMVERPVVAMKDGDIPEGKAARVPIARTGRYKTAKKVWCLPAGQSGPLEFCGPEASLAAGEVIFSTTGPEREPDLDMDELVAELERPMTEAFKLSEKHRWQQQRSEDPALHLLALRVPHGEQAAPACRIDAGVHLQREGACFAASGPADRVLGRWWLAGAPELRPAELTRLAAPAPKTAKPLRVGLSRLVWKGPTARFRLPAEPSRIELLLPGDAWAVQVDRSGRATDLCAPAGALARCVLGGAGGQLYLISDAERQARARVVLVTRPPGRVALDGLHERWSKASGRTSLDIEAAPAARLLKVYGAQACKLALDDGTRSSGCEAVLPAGSGGLLEIEHGSGPLQAVVTPADRLDRTRWGGDPPAGPAPPLGLGQATALTGERIARSLVLPEAALVHLQADAGLCALVAPDGRLRVYGQGRGCAVSRLLEKGVHRVLVRGFAGQELGGSLVWTAEPVEQLSEGVGLEDWLAPGQSRTYRFDVAAEGEIGLGVRLPADLLTCQVLDSEQRLIGQGCQQFLELAAGRYLLTLSLGERDRPLRYRPVLLGLAGSKLQVPEGYLRDFFQRIGFKPQGGAR